MTKDTYSREEVKSFVSHISSRLFNFKGFESALEDWEKAQEVKQYPDGILSLKLKDGHISEYTNTEHEYYHWIRINTENNGAIIFSVKNKHGEVLTVGCSVTGENVASTIKEFRISNGDIIAIFSDHNPEKSIFHLSNIAIVHPIKTFKTEDGYEVKEDEHIWCVDKEKFQLQSECFDGCSMNLEFYIHFKYKENAEEYIGLNKPRYSKQDITNAGVFQCNIGREGHIFTIDKTKLGLE